VRIYCDGIYDLFHYGHARSLEQAKKAFPNVYLLVGVCNDTETHTRKGKTVMRDYERYLNVEHCKWVDEVVKDAPWIVDDAFLEKHAIDYVAHDDIPYASGGVADVYGFVKKRGKFLPTKRTEGVSTSDLITRIVRDYDEYLRRNLARGVSPRDLNIGFFKEKSIQMAQSMTSLTDEIKSELAEWKDEWRETIRTWEEKSQHYVKGFVEAFKNGVR
jgi:choline-phosphate cytidylyltransferase